MKAQLTAISKRGKQLISEYGDIWLVIAKSDILHINDISSSQGPFHMVKPIHKEKYSRWVCTHNDPTFKITIIED